MTYPLLEDHGVCRGLYYLTEAITLPELSPCSSDFNAVACARSPSPSLTKDERRQLPIYSSTGMCHCENNIYKKKILYVVSFSIYGII
jgi:hypothetical protein